MSKEEVTGYVHVSEVCIGRQGGRYFDFKIQETKDVYTRVACFSPDKWATLKNNIQS